MPRRSAFVTGAARNIGRAIAHELADRQMDLVLTTRSDAGSLDTVAAECRARGVEVLTLVGDLGSMDDCQRLANEALAWRQHIDVLVLCAAIRPTRSLLETTPEDWAQMMDTNLNSAFILTRAFLPGMISAGYGRVVGFTGMNAIRGVHRGGVAASKYGQWGLIKSVSQEFGAVGISANAVSPGPIAHDDVLIENARGAPPAIVPAQRRGTPAEVAALVGFLASEEGAYVNGQMIAVNGGGT